MRCSAEPPNRRPLHQPSWLICLPEWLFFYQPSEAMTHRRPLPGLTGQPVLQRQGVGCRVKPGKDGEGKDGKGNDGRGRASVIVSPVWYDTSPQGRLRPSAAPSIQPDNQPDNQPKTQRQPRRQPAKITVPS